MSAEHLVTKKRHLAKTISYRIISTGIGFLIVWAISGTVAVGAAFSLMELIYKPVQYYLHERIWYKWIPFGLKLPDPEPDHGNEIELMDDADLNDWHPHEHA